MESLDEGNSNELSITKVLPVRHVMNLTPSADFATSNETKSTSFGCCPHERVGCFWFCNLIMKLKLRVS